MKVLVTGGLGYIGSHTCVELLDASYDVVIVDNLSNSKADVVEKIEKISGKTIKFYYGDVCDSELLDKIFTENKIDAVIHFAAFKAVGESVSLPLNYYENNLLSTIRVCKTMIKYGCNKLIFSSSATVYGSPATLPIKEDFPLSATNPYGYTKLMNEQILKDVVNANKDFSVIILRYFNPIGAHSSGLIGEDPNGIPNNLMPYIVKVATGELSELKVFGDDYDTPDGTGVRDYIHVVDLAKGHVKAMEKVLVSNGIDYYNLGTGNGYSVLDLIKTFERVNNVKVAYKIVDRRAGDIASCYADCSRALSNLDWKAEYGIDEMCRDAYNFKKVNR